MLGAVSLRLACLQSPSLYDTTHHRFCDMLRICKICIIRPASMDPFHKPLKGTQ